MVCGLTVACRHGGICGTAVVERESRFTPYPGNLTQLLVQALAGRAPRLTTGTVTAGLGSPGVIRFTAG